MPNKNYSESNKEKVYTKGQSMTKTNNKKSLDSIIEEFNIKASEVDKPAPNVIDSLTYSYTYTGEHYDTLPRDDHWTKQFASTELAVNITDAISYAVRDGLANADVAVVLGKILNEVKHRQKQ
jgi:hypothetical protein